MAGAVLVSGLRSICREVTVSGAPADTGGEPARLTKACSRSAAERAPSPLSAPSATRGAAVLPCLSRCARARARAQPPSISLTTRWQKKQQVSSPPEERDSSSSSWSRNLSATVRASATEVPPSNSARLNLVRGKPQSRSSSERRQPILRLRS